MDLPISGRLETAKLARIFDSTAESYKFFWFGAVLDRIVLGHEEAVFSDLVDEMIASAWYMVSEYHLSLGPSDTMEKLILELQGITPLKSSEKKSEIIRYLDESDSKEIRKRRLTLIKEVPFRLQSTLLNLSAKEWQKGSSEKIRLINAHEDLIYTFGEYKGLDTVIYFNPLWDIVVKLKSKVDPRSKGISS